MQIKLHYLYEKHILKNLHILNIIISYLDCLPHTSRIPMTLSETLKNPEIIEY